MTNLKTMNERTLKKNKVSQFLLRIDLEKSAVIDFRNLSEILADDYSTTQTELHVNYCVNINAGQVNKEDYIKFVLKSPGVKLTLDSFQKCITIESNKYEDNSIYKNRIAKIISILTSTNPGLNSERIGLRYINVFPCEKISDISKILNASDAKSVKDSLSHDNIARSIFIQEFQHEDCMSRVQFGVFNKFYPSIIANYDITLDIDVYCSGLISIDNWNEFIRRYNHLAYETFISYIRDKYLESLK